LVSLALAVFWACDDTSDPENTSDCGNGVIDEGEECDTDDLDGETCSSRSAGLGDLACTSECVFDETGCSFGSECGDGIVGDGEDCDGSDLDGQTCESLGYSSGTLYCGEYCDFDVVGCAGTGDDCGNGVREGQEECDGSDLGGYDCVMLGYSGGELGCDTHCMFDASGCTD
jgi:hypothetical protein